MCDFKPGDEVVCVDARNRPGRVWVRDIPMEGQSYQVVFVVIDDEGKTCLILKGMHSGNKNGEYLSARFRKVQRRDISQWLETATEYEEPKRKKAKA